MTRAATSSQARRYRVRDLVWRRLVQRVENDAGVENYALLTVTHANSLLGYSSSIATLLMTMRCIDATGGVSLQPSHFIDRK